MRTRVIALIDVQAIKQVKKINNMHRFQIKLNQSEVKNDQWWGPNRRTVNHSTNKSNMHGLIGNNEVGKQFGDNGVER